MVNMAKKPSFQRAILKTLSSKKVVPIESIKKEVVEAVLGDSSPDNKANYAVARSIKNLVGDGLVETFNSDHNQYLRLTKEGKQKLNNIALFDEYTLVSTSWDGFWRIIILDLPEERKNERESLRYLLKKAGFVCIKNSVWISMYPYEHLFINIKNDLGLSTEMMIIVTDKIDKETEKEFFSVCGLSK